MYTHAIYKASGYGDSELYETVKKHFETHGIEKEIPKDAKVLIKPNLVLDKDAAFSVTTNPNFVYAIIKYLHGIGVYNITVADCPGGALLMLSDIESVYRRTGYSFLSESAKLNTDFESCDIEGSKDFINQKFNVINAVADADYIINVPKLKTHNLTCITAGVKNLFGCIPGLQKPAFHAKYPAAADFSNMLVELAATVKPDFTIVDAIEIMEGNGPVNGKKRYLGVTFSSKDVFGIDKFIADTLNIPTEKIGTVAASEKKGLIEKNYLAEGDTDFRPEKPILLPGSARTETKGGMIAAKIVVLYEKIENTVLMKYPKMNKKCVLCKKCVLTCPKQALSVENKKIVLDKKSCIGCLCCDEVCPNAAVDIKKKIKRR